LEFSLIIQPVDDKFSLNQILLHSGQVYRHGKETEMVNNANKEASKASVNVRLGSRDAARYCALGFSTLAKFRIKSGGPRYYKIGAKVLYDSADLDAWLASKRAAHTSQY
jgi:hypothetical protein